MPPCAATYRARTSVEVVSAAVSVGAETAAFALMSPGSAAFREGARLQRARPAAVARRGMAEVFA